MPTQVWRIENLELAEVSPSMYGQFYGGDCYVVLYTYNRSGRQQYILYMWQVCVVLCKQTHNGNKIKYKLQTQSHSADCVTNMCPTPGPTCHYG